MNLVDIKDLLIRYGFKDLTLVSSDESTKTHNFKFREFDPKRIPVKPTMAGGGKVAVFNLPEIGKIGVNPESKAVRFIDAGKTVVKPQANDSHLGFVQVPDLYADEFKKAQINTSYRLKFMAALWSYLNEHKFQSKMKQPKLEAGPRPSLGGVKTNTRGAYWSQGILWMNSFMFNARFPFFLEVFLHEMCHEANWEIDRNTDRSLQGHGPNWQKWMRHVGLDPRRYDPTDDYEYKTSSQRAEQEAEYSEEFGPRADAADIKRLRKMTSYNEGPAIFEHKGRLLKGVLRHDPRYKMVSFTYRTPKHDLMSFQWPTMSAFMRTAISHFYHQDNQ